MVHKITFAYKRRFAMQKQWKHKYFMFLVPLDKVDYRQVPPIKLSFFTKPEKEE